MCKMRVLSCDTDQLSKLTYLIDMDNIYVVTLNVIINNTHLQSEKDVCSKCML